MFGIASPTRSTITEYDPPTPVRDPPRRDVHRRRHVSRSSRARTGRRRSSAGRSALVAPVLPHLGRGRHGTGLPAIFQRDLERLARPRRSRRGVGRRSHARPPRRRHVRAVPRPLRAAATGPRTRRDPPLWRVRPVRPAAVPAPRGGRHARRLRHGPGHRVLPQRPVPGLQVVGRDAARAPRPVPHRGSGGRGAGHRPLADGRVRGRRRDRCRGLAVRRPTRTSSASSCARPTRTWPSSWSTSGSCSGTDGAPSSTTRPASAPSGAWRPTSIPDWLGLVGDSSDGFPGLPGWGAKSAAAVLDVYGHYETIPPKASAWEVPGVGGGRAMTLAATLRDHWDEALLYRDLARLRTAEDGVPIRQETPRTCAGTARRARPGRRSARSGDWTGCAIARIAGWTRADGARRRRPGGADERRPRLDSVGQGSLRAAS